MSADWIGETSLDVRMFDNQGLSPAVTMAQRMHLELLDAGITQATNPAPMWNDPALVAFDGKTPVGMMIYRHEPSQAMWFILSAYVVPYRRRQGIHSLLFRTLVERAKKRGDIIAIQSGTHINNKASQRAQVKQGRVPIAVYYEYRLRDHEESSNPLEIKP